MLLAAFIFGLLSSLHCVGMCGPIVFALPIYNGTTFQKWTKLLSYHVGRIITYGIIGFVFGILGRTFYLAGLQQTISIILGVLFILLAFFQSFFIYKAEKMGHHLIGQKIQRSMASLLQQKNQTNFMILGFLNGWLPCGIVYIALMSALTTTSVVQGITYMIFFGLGTIPLMMLVSVVRLFKLNVINPIIKKIIPLYFLVMGSLFILRGFGLGIAMVSPSNASLQIQLVPIGCH